IYIPGIGQSVQPSEFLKLALALWLGLVLARKGRLLDEWRHALVPRPRASRPDESPSRDPPATADAAGHVAVMVSRR
ncbi:FtsW/RodA/SpoVE family cell cycle protein, partial [Klebsiella pneumoniae]|nr:FtsW/RodA/SpoVE family cell cycle protein [Klebsiella pneumoniae]